MNPSKVNDPRFWKKWYESGAVSGIVKSPYQIAAGNMNVKKVLENDYVLRVIEEASRNWTQRFLAQENPWIRTVLLEFSTRVCQIILSSPKVTFPDFSPGWKGRISDECFDILSLKELIAREKIAVSSQFGRTISLLALGEDQWVMAWSLTKIANTVACVAYVLKNGLDPSILESSYEEIQESLFALAKKRMDENPDGVIMLDPNQDLHEMVGEILLRINPPDITDILSEVVR